MKSGAVPVRNPVGAAAAIDTGSANVTSAAFTQLIAAASMLAGCSAIIVTNGGSQALALAKGGAGSEVLTGAVIPPASGQLMIPIEIAKTTRLSLKSLGATQSSGVVTISFFA